MKPEKERLRAQKTSRHQGGSNCRGDLRIGSSMNFAGLGDTGVQARFRSGEYSDNSVIEFVVNVSGLF